MRLIRLTCLAYVLMMSFLLLTPDPLGFLRVENSPSVGGRGSHFCMFALLAFLVYAAFPKMSWRWTLAALFGYALGTETLQTLVPTRTVELFDYLENLFGLAAGTTAWLAAKKAWAAWSARRDNGRISQIHARSASE